eukprot:jgi/Bigna1/90773/estExt_fgenesh1_pg.C_790013
MLTVLAILALFASAADAQACTTTRALVPGQYLCSRQTTLPAALRYSWAINGTHITFEITANADGYVGLGFGGDTPATPMLNGMAWIGFCDVGGTIMDVQEYNFNGRQPVATGAILSDASCLDTGLTTTVRFTRTLAAPNAQSFDIMPDTPMTMIWATSENDMLGQHAVADRGANTVDLDPPISGPCVVGGDVVQGQYQCSFTTPTNGLSFQWSVSQTQIAFQVSAQVVGYVAIGFAGPIAATPMVNGQAIIGFCGPNGGQPTLLEDFVFNGRQPIAGLNQSISNTFCFDDGTTTTVQFTINLRGGDFDIGIQGPQTMIWATSGSDAVAQHAANDRSAGMVDLSADGMVEDDGDDDGDDVCFSGSSMLTLKSGEKKAIKDITIGESVVVTAEDGSLTHGKVVFLPHTKGNNHKIRFLELTTNKASRIQLSRKHLILANDCGKDSKFELYHASDVTLAMCLSGVDGPEKVIQIGRFRGEGIYSVITDHSHGLIVVDGLRASSFAVNHGIVNAFYHIHRCAAKVLPKFFFEADFVVSAHQQLGKVAQAVYSLF